MASIKVQAPEYDARQGFAIVDEDLVEVDNTGILIDGLDEDQATYAAMILENDGFGDLTGLGRADIAFVIESAVERVQTEHGVVFAAETREWAL